MTEGIKSTLGKSDFIIRYPLIFATIVFIGTELVLWLMRVNKDLSYFSAEPMKVIVAMLIKFLIFVGLAYGYGYFKKYKLNNN